MRDRALVHVGFAGALRRGELVGLDVDDVRFEDEGLVLRLRRSKSIPVARRYIRAGSRWLDHADAGIGL